MLAINEEFESYQGEGNNTGVRQYFIRTQGCEVGCYFCDTKHSWRKGDDIVDEYDIIGRANLTKCSWICITGGEPLEQDLSELVRIAKDSKYRIQLETSGMYWQPCVKQMDWVCVSPKNLFAKKGMGFEYGILQHTNEIKCVVTKESDINYYMREFADFHGIKTFQPMDNRAEIAQMILKFPSPKIGDWRLMIQQHKILELR